LKSEISTAKSEQVLQHVADMNQKTNSLLSSLSELKSAISAESELEFRNFNRNQKISTVTSEFFDQQFSTHNMTRSSESASIAHYELQNARRESLLTQN
jgi:hypothetical protein